MRRFGGPERPKIDPSRLASRSDGPFRPTKSIQDRSNGLFRQTWSTLVARKTLRRVLLVDLGSYWTLVGRIFPRVHRFSACPRLRGFPENLEKPVVFISFSTFSWNRLFVSVYCFGKLGGFVPKISPFNRGKSR